MLTQPLYGSCFTPSHIAGQRAAIRLFNPQSVEEYSALKEVMEDQEVKKWMVDVGEMTYAEYVRWCSEINAESVLYAVLDASDNGIDTAHIYGFVYLYTGLDEKARIDRMTDLGLLPSVSGSPHVLEVSFARRRLDMSQPPKTGLISSALRQACLQTRNAIGSFQAMAFIDQQNLAAQRTVTAAGFLRVGKMKYDVDSLQEDFVYLLDWNQLQQRVLCT